jgi:6-phosphogluconolactonase/glucosamine-6-phosphate isomerase/deaminase
MNIRNETSREAVGHFLAEKIIGELKNGSVLWLIPGGSSIPVAAEAAKEISAADHSKLMVTLTDERYGPVGHPDSNWKQLLDTGFSLPQARLVPVLSGQARFETTIAWGNTLHELLARADYVLGFFGIGADGHIAGMLPHTAPLESDEFTDSYAAEKFERITITPSVIPCIDEVVAFAAGENKWPVLSRLREEVDVAENPVQLLKTVDTFTLFTDLKV